MLWASALDDTDENTRFMSRLLNVFLDNTRDRVPFTDWFETDTAICREFRHRTVQGGLWMPVLKAKWANYAHYFQVGGKASPPAVFMP